MACDVFHKLAASCKGQNSVLFGFKSDLSLKWAAQPPAPDKLSEQDGHYSAAASDHAIFLGGLAYGVTRLKSRCHFGDANKHVQAVTEMNGACCSTRAMRIGPAPSNGSEYTYQPNFDNSTQGTDSYHDQNNSGLFVGCLDKSITDDDLLRAFNPYGELVNVKVLASKACGFVTYSNSASAEEAMRMLNGSKLGGYSMRLSWGCRSGNKQTFVGCIDRSFTYDDPLQAFCPYGEPDVKVLAGMSCGFVTYSVWPSAEEAMRMLNGSELGGNAMRIWGHHSANKQYQQDRQNDGWYCFDSSGFGWSPELGNFSKQMMDDAHCSTLKNDDPMAGMVASMGASILLRRGFSGTGGGGSGGPEEFWHWVEQTYSKPFLEKLDSGLTGMGYNRPTGRMSRIFICALAYSMLCQA